MLKKGLLHEQKKWGNKKLTSNQLQITLKNIMELLIYISRHCGVFQTLILVPSVPIFKTMSGKSCSRSILTILMPWKFPESKSIFLGWNNSKCFMLWWHDVLASSGNTERRANTRRNFVYLLLNTTEIFSLSSDESQNSSCNKFLFFPF